MDKLLDRLNSDQIKPVKDTEGPVLVLAGAGSGKTRVLTSRAAYILREGKADLSQLLCITFTNKAAAEMKERMEELLGRTFTYDEGRWICTIHSMCVKILREFAEEAGLHHNFSIYSEQERTSVIKKVFKELGYEDEKLLKSVKYHIPNAKMLGLEPDQYAKKYSYEKDINDVVQVYEAYCRQLDTNNALDFDDLLLRARRLLRSNDDARDYFADKFKYIMVDEFQDTNAVQYDIIKLLASGHGNIFAVGDDDQSIYGWRGAEIQNILSFDKDYPNAKIYKLERNYRSTGNILNLANAIIRNNRGRHAKKLWTDAGEGERPVYMEADEEAAEALYTANMIRKGVENGGKYSDYAVLMRINALTRSYEQEFNKYNIPYKVFGGFRFFERREIKDILAYFQLIANPFDNEAFERIINVPRRGIGARTLEVMREYVAQTGLTMFDAAADSDTLSLPSTTKQKLKDFNAMIKKFVIASLEMQVNELAHEIIDTTSLKTAYQDGTEEGDEKVANLNEFLASVDDYSRLNPGATVEDYLTQVTLSTDLDEMDDGDYVTLATIHAVKGLEFNTVFICGLEEGIIPTSRAINEDGDIEEERRLMYVAITRAKTGLYFTRSRTRYLYGHRDISAPSRFVRELAKELCLTKHRGSYVQSYGAKGSGASGSYISGPFNVSGGNGYGSDGYSNDGYGSDSYNGYGSSGYGNSGYGGGNGGKYGGSYGNSSSYGGSRGKSNADLFSDEYPDEFPDDDTNGRTFGGSGSNRGSSRGSSYGSSSYGGSGTPRSGSGSSYGGTYGGRNSGSGSSGGSYGSGSSYGNSSYGSRNTGSTGSANTGRTNAGSANPGGTGRTGTGVAGTGSGMPAAGNSSAAGGNKQYYTGMKVSHPKFGIGYVVSVRSNGNVIMVAFEGQGVKELSAALAPLTILKQ